MDTGDIDADFAVLVGGEGAANIGSLNLQAEYIYSHVNSTEGKGLGFNGYYAQIGWFVTGESRNYDVHDGYFGRQRPLQSLSITGGGAGALELAARFSHIDLNDDPVKGGRMTILMTGFTWYLNRNVRIMVNGGLGTVDHDPNDGRLYILQTRLQFYF